MTFTSAALALLKRLEGLRLSAYRDAGGVLTIGYGHTGGVKPDSVLTAHQAEVVLDSDLGRFIPGVEHLIEGAPLPLADAQFSALVIFAFNVGLVAFEGSTARRDVLSGHLDAVPAALALWNKVRDASGVLVVNAGLVHRRQAEIDLWNSARAALPVA